MRPLQRKSLFWTSQGFRTSRVNGHFTVREKYSSSHIFRCLACAQFVKHSFPIDTADCARRLGTTIIISIHVIMQVFCSGMTIKTGLVSHWWTGTITVILRVQNLKFVRLAKSPDSGVLSAVRQRTQDGHVFIFFSCMGHLRMKFTFCLHLLVNMTTAITLSMAAHQTMTQTTWMWPSVATNHDTLIKTAPHQPFSTEKLNP